MEPEKLPNPAVDKGNQSGVIPASQVIDNQNINSNPGTPPQHFVSMVSDDKGVTENRSGRRKKLLILIAVGVVIILLATLVYFLVFHKSNKQGSNISTPSSSKSATSSSSQSTKSSNSSDTSTTSVATCKASPVVGLSCYDLSMGPFSLLFFPSATVSTSSSGVLQIISPANGSTTLQFADAGTAASACTDQTNIKQLFNYTSNGTPEVACYDTVDGSYQYSGAIQINSHAYYLNMVSQAPISTALLQSIFTSITPM
jgi:hypothetical protein